MQEANRVQQLERATGMVCTQTNGQRLWCLPEGPFVNWEHGSEIFFSNFPHNETEEPLFEIFKEHGKILQIRLMVRYDGQNKGFGFMLFSSPEEAERAVHKENGRPLHSVDRTWNLKVCLSKDNRRLFIGRIPKTLSKAQLCGVVSCLTEGFKKAFLYKDWEFPTLNRGFAFLEYDTHHHATKAKITLTRCLPENLRTNEVIVNWAIPEPSIEKKIMDKVKKVFIRGLRLKTTCEHIRKVVSDAIGSEVNLNDVKKSRDYAFVHFTTRKATMAALKQLDGTVIDGVEVEVLLARPLHRALKWKTQNSATYKLHPNHQKVNFSQISDLNLPCNHAVPSHAVNQLNTFSTSGYSSSINHPSEYILPYEEVVGPSPSNFFHNPTSPTLSFGIFDQSAGEPCSILIEMPGISAGCLPCVECSSVGRDVEVPGKSYLVVLISIFLVKFCQEA
ncbi:putative RNA-binding protein 46 [Homalodisca vitripennis]|nr:putative RNA-binding protein 46 [Homalodisca vitripennis]